jgi:hypothetical protein
MRSLAIMRETGAPVVFDATHSVQLPGGQGTSSGGAARDGAGAGAARRRGRGCGRACSWKPTPTQANGLSDGPNAVPLKHMKALLETLAGSWTGDQSYERPRPLRHAEQYRRPARAPAPRHFNMVWSNERRNAMIVDIVGREDSGQPRQPHRRMRRAAGIRHHGPRRRASLAPPPAAAKPSSCATATRAATWARACSRPSSTSTPKSPKPCWAWTPPSRPSWTRP